MTSLSAEPVRLTTRSGLSIDVRPATPEDDTLIRDLFDSVSPEDRRFRFLSACEHVSNDQVRAMTDVDHWRTESFLAFVDREAVATGMLASDQAMHAAEVAISIRANRKGQGIGWTLLEYLAGIARERGIKKLLSIESRENHSTIELEREMGFVAKPVEGDATLVQLEVQFQA